MKDINEVDMIKNIFSIFGVRKPKSIVLEEGKISFSDATGRVVISQEIYPPAPLDTLEHTSDEY